MCVIIYKPAGVALPNIETLRDCYLTNSDGAGFMYPQKGKVRISKGHMTFEHLTRALDKVTNATSVPMVLHFRIGTQGKNDASNTHPFPVTDRVDALRARSAVADVALAHNGIIPLTTYQTKGDAKEQHSDTFYFVRDYARRIITATDWYTDHNKVELLEVLAESKLCILSSDGHVEMVGAFEYDEDDHCYYSNKYHEWYGYGKRGSAHRYTYDRYDDDDDDDASFALTGTIRADHVRASFVRDEHWLYNEETGTLLDSSSALFAVDSLGAVYEFVDDMNALVPMGAKWSVVDDDIDPQVIDMETAAVFTVYER